MRDAMDFKLFPTLAALGVPKPRGVLQIGASYGQELQEFVDNGLRAGVFVEPLPVPYKRLAESCMKVQNFIAVNALCTDVEGRSYQFNVADNDGMSSSILTPNEHLKVFDQVTFSETTNLVSTTVDSIASQLKQRGFQSALECLDLLYMDCQGAEYRILLGANATLSQINYIYMEVMRGSLYLGQVPFLTYCNHLEAVGFTLNDVHFQHPGHWGNALFIRKSLLGLTN